MKGRAAPRAVGPEHTPPWSSKGFLALACRITTQGLSACDPPHTAFLSSSDYMMDNCFASYSTSLSFSSCQKNDSSSSYNNNYYHCYYYHYNHVLSSLWDCGGDRGDSKSEKLTQMIIISGESVLFKVSLNFLKR